MARPRTRPFPVRAVRRTAQVALDAVELLSGRREPGLPPRSLRDLAGGGDYHQIGEHLVEQARELGGLAPDARVLDVGAGTGRVATALIPYLSPRGSYDGLEIVRPAVRWCRRQISREHPNFRFHHANVYNGLYNPGGRVQVEDSRFPFEDGSFDFTFITSVFTHLPRATVERYLKELGRVFATNGRAMATFFLLNDDSSSCIAEGLSSHDLSHPANDGSMVADPNVPEHAIGHPEEWVTAVVARSGLIIEPPIHYGTWSGAGAGASYQDILILRKA